MNDEHYALAFPGGAATQAVTANRFCRIVQGSEEAFSGAGLFESMNLPKSQTDVAPTLGYLWKTFDLNTGAKCTGAQCKAFAIIECVRRGSQRMQPDGQGNIGCANTGACVRGRHWPAG